jgi:hypothetical protein
MYSWRHIGWSCHTALGLSVATGQLKFMKSHNPVPSRISHGVPGTTEYAMNITDVATATRVVEWNEAHRGRGESEQEIAWIRSFIE